MADHKHEPFLFQYRQTSDGRDMEVWRCQADFPVSDVVTDEDGNEVPGRTLYPGDPSHPHGEPCGWQAEREYDPKRWTAERGEKYGTQRALFRANAPKDNAGSSDGSPDDEGAEG